MNVGQLCNRDVVTADQYLPVLEAARRMRAHHVGDLVVVEAVRGGTEPIGIVTDRDLVLEVLAENIEWAASLRVCEIMTCEPVTAREDEDATVVLHRMRCHGVRRLPVVDARGAVVST